jgi:two-component system cell cycle response regulator
MKLTFPNFLTTKRLTVKQVLIRIALIELTLELLIMLVFRYFAVDTETLINAVLDPILLVCFSLPLIYLFVIRPFVKAHDEAIIRINHLAHTDPLTKLANRRLIQEYLQVMVESKAKTGEHGAILLLDLDGFKPINDDYGHDAGDAVLVTVADRLKHSVRNKDVVGRLGGDEYIVLLRQLGADLKLATQFAQFVANKLIEEVKLPVKFQGHQLKLSTSVGIRVFGAEHTEVDQLIADADKALYRAKENGKGRAELF